MFYRLISTSNDRTLAVARLLLGIVFFAHGAQKMLGWFGGTGYTAHIHAFASMGLPATIGFLIIFTEFFGALSLIFGLFSRLAGLGIIALMAGAVITVHSHVGFFMNWAGQQKGEGYEYHLLVVALALLILV